MAWALAQGMISHFFPIVKIHIVETIQKTHRRWLEQDISISEIASQKLCQADIVIFAVKPQDMRQAVRDVRPYLAHDAVVVSIAAGIRSDTLAAWLGTVQIPWRKLVRCMPNTPALVGAGACGLAALVELTERDQSRVTKIFESVGTVVWVDDDVALDAITALSGSGPAYVFLFIEALIAGGCSQGLDAKQARTLALATVAGAVHLATESNQTLETLRKNVTSPGGTTAAALAIFESNDLCGLVTRAMAAAAERSRNLAAEAERA